MSFNLAISTQLAQKLKALHKPGQPVVFTNIWDAPSTSLALSHAKTKALATASYAIAAVAGLEDPDLTLEDNLYAISKICARIVKEGKAESVPLTVDLQDGYGARLKEIIEKIVELGVVGCNLEDSKIVDGGETKLIEPEEHADRIELAIDTARAKGVEDFVVNARTDCVLLGGTIEEAIRRGKLYLAAGATTVFVWGGLKRGLRDAEVKQLVDGLKGRVNVIYRKGMQDSLSVGEIAKLGVARISMGPGIWRDAMAAVDIEMGRILKEYA
jgi:2-methylisocitrate lyase-like PEP mutase family enzyme